LAGEEAVVPTPGTPEHDAAMAAKADAVMNPTPVETAAPAEEQPAGDRPAWLPEKFQSPEDLAKAYAELEQKQGAKEPEGEPKPEDDANAQAEDVVAKAGLDMSALSAEFQEKGELSTESYAALEAVGFDRNYVDSFIAGQQALARESQTRAFDIAGGETEYTNMVAWAAANLDIKEIQAYNQAIEGTAEQAALAVAGLKSKYVSVNGSEPSLLNGGGGLSGEQGFASTAEMTAAMKDPRYAKDPAYRKSVEQRVSVSKIF
jgi:hypothetical protein